MSLGAVAYAIAIAVGLSTSAPTAVTVAIADGLKVLWNPMTLLFIQFLWLAAFIYTGRSEVTGATIEFHVHQHRI